MFVDQSLTERLMGFLKRTKTCHLRVYRGFVGHEVFEEIAAWLDEQPEIKDTRTKLTALEAENAELRELLCKVKGHANRPKVAGDDGMKWQHLLAEVGRALKTEEK